MSGGTTENEPAAANARTSQAPTHQDLQSTIAPQLTTTGDNPELQAEIPQEDEAQPHHDVLMLPLDLDTLADLLTDESQSELEYEKVLREITTYLELARNISTSLIVAEDDCLKFKSYPKAKLLTPNQDWIGRLII